MRARRGGAAGPVGVVRVDSLAQGLGLLLVALGLTWGLVLALRPEPSPTTSSFAPPGSLSHRTTCHIRGARLVASNTDALHVWFRLAGGGKAVHVRRGTLVTAGSAGCSTVDTCLAHLQDPFECYYDATQRSVSLIDDTTPTTTVDWSGEDVAVRIQEEEHGLDRRGWFLLVVFSVCLCTPLCCLLGVVSVIEGLGLPLPCRLDEARCAVRQKLRRTAVGRNGKT